MTYGLDPAQLLRHIIRPVLQRRLDLWSPSAEVLVLGTAMVESELRYVDQIDKRRKPGPAFGLWQCEGPTHADHYWNFLVYNPELRQSVLRLASHFSGEFPDPGEMVFNLAYAAAMCRIHYRRLRAALPPTNNARLMAEFHKTYYNTIHGKTKVEESVVHFEAAIRLSAQV